MVSGTLARTQKKAMTHSTANSKNVVPAPIALMMVRKVMLTMKHAAQSNAVARGQGAAVSGRR